MAAVADVCGLWEAVSQLGSAALNDTALAVYAVQNSARQNYIQVQCKIHTDTEIWSVYI